MITVNIADPSGKNSANLAQLELNIQIANSFLGTAEAAAYIALARRYQVQILVELLNTQSLLENSEESPACLSEQKYTSNWICDYGTGVDSELNMQQRYVSRDARHRYQFKHATIEPWGSTEFMY